MLLARTGGADTKRAEALSVFLVDLREAVPAGQVTIKPIDAMINHNTNSVYIDQLYVRLALSHARTDGVVRVGSAGRHALVADISYLIVWCNQPGAHFATLLECRLKYKLY